MNTEPQTPEEGFSEKDMRLMRRAVRSEYEDPHSPQGGPDAQAAIFDYLHRGGSNGDTGDLYQLHHEAQEAEGIEY